MPGKHASKRRSPVLPALVALLVVGMIAAAGFVLGGYASKAESATDSCAESQVVSLAVAPALAPVIEEASVKLEAQQAAVDGVCIDFAVAAVSPEQVLTMWTTEPDKVAQLWIPDFAVWVTRATLAGATPAVLSNSLVKTPVVVAGREAGQPASWMEVGQTTVAYLDPLKSSASTAALLSAFGEMVVTGASELEMGSMMVPLAQRYGAQANKPTTVEEVASAAEEGTYGVMTEQELVHMQAAGRAKGLTATVPKSGTMVLDFPLAALSSDRVSREAGTLLASYMVGDEGEALGAAAGFRNNRNEPLASGEGLGATSFRVLSMPDAERVNDALRRWSVLTVPSRAITVIDVSGSMDHTDAGQTRIALAVDAAEQALQLFPDNAQIGLWAFSLGLGGGSRDYLPMLPVRALGDPVDGGTQRDALAKALRRLPDLTDGGTGLYDTALAAIRTMQSDYDPTAVNSVFLLTDGKNEDDRSLSLEELIATIERERDPARPVQIIAIGMGPEADAEALQRIAGATGGRSYIAKQPSDIGRVFIDAMLSR